MVPLAALLFALALIAVVLGSVADSITSLHLVLLYLLVLVVAVNQYEFRRTDGISPLAALQTALALALAVVTVRLVDGGLGSRTLELVGVMALLVILVLAREDLSRSLRINAPYVVAFAVLVGVFFYHAREFGSASGLGLFPVFAAMLLAFNLFVVPKYVGPDAVSWTIAVLAAAVAVVGLPAVVYGDFTLRGLEVRTWSGDVSLVVTEVTVIRSIFANPNTLGLLLFPGVVLSAVGIHRSLSQPRSHTSLTALGVACLVLTGLGLHLSNSRASMLAAGVAVAIYAAYVVVGRRIVPVALLATAIGVPALLAAIYFVLPIDPANRFALWGAGLEAARTDSGLLGQGIIDTREAIEPYHDLDGGGSVHNSYLSISIRVGILGALAYLVLVIGPLVHGAIRYDRVNVGMLALATGFAVHQLFEGYTLYQSGPGSVIGALAVGYVIHSLISTEAQPSQLATDPDETKHQSSLEETFGSPQARDGVESERHNGRS